MNTRIIVGGIATAGIAAALTVFLVSPPTQALTQDVVRNINGENTYLAGARQVAPEYIDVELLKIGHKTCTMFREGDINPFSVLGVATGAGMTEEKYGLVAAQAVLHLCPDQAEYAEAVKKRIDNGGVQPVPYEGE